ncbi:MAG TPA: radical SAM protein, partial [Salinivirgaceae bacterium]|nr:radical SAM protein [Salinivirgaceae bacterium]
MSEKIPLLGKTPEEINEVLSNLNLPRFTSKQISEWIYRKRVWHFDEMTNLSLATRRILNEKYTVGFHSFVQRAVSNDGTEKYLYNVGIGFVESVYIPEETRATLCISSQVGCRYACTFCATGKQGFSGNLNSGDILNQILTNPFYEKLTNIVFMGMGEPLDNIEEVIKTCNIMSADWGLAMSPRRVTVSTIGLTQQLERIIQETECHLAISLHSPFDEERQKIMPGQKSN